MLKALLPVNKVTSLGAYVASSFEGRVGVYHGKTDNRGPATHTPNSTVTLDCANGAWVQLVVN
jgi:hypothetical protein